MTIKLLLLALVVLGSPHGSSQTFVGIWQSKPSPLTHKPTFTVNLSSRGTELQGSVTFVNPNGSETVLTIHDAKVASQVLDFQTGAGDETLLFSVKLGRANLAHLSLRDYRRTKWGHGSELFAEEDLRRK
jgi:hypothetical protein